LQRIHHCLTCIDQEADRLLWVAGSPLYHKKIDFFELTYKARTHVYLDRVTCCYWYRTDGGDYCSTCPHWTKEDRNGCLLKHLAKE
jgi:ferric iron reductase protein FhuF